MIGKSYILLLLLQAGLAQEWKAKTQGEVVAQEGSCAQIPCHYNYPSHLANLPRIGIWFNNKNSETSSTVFHSKDHSRELARFLHRTQLSGDLKGGDCSLIIKGITQEDAGPYYFRVEFDNVNSYSYLPATWLQVSGFTDKPMIFPVEIIAGKRVNLRCTFNTTCKGTAPVLTWDTPTAVTGSVSNTVTQRDVTLTYTTVLSLIPTPRYQGQTLTCRISYPTVSSEQTITLTVQYSPRNLSITSLAVIKDSSISVIEGNSAVIICSVVSFPASNLMWRHLNITMNRTSSSNELWLEIPHITYRETGDYQCVAENEHGAVEGSITIAVEYSPRNLSITSLAVIKDSSISVIEGNSAVIICSVESFPASNLMWRHLNVIMNRTSSNNELWLEIPHITYRATGNYQCVAENEHGAVEGSVTITVEYTPRNLSITSLAAIKDSSISVIEGNSAVIICSVVSFPASNLMWRYLNITVNRTSSSNELWLKIPHITNRETGDYQCVAENEHGAVEGSITITVEYSPRNLSITSLAAIKDSSISVIEGNSAVIICSVVSFPASNLMWRHLNVTVNRTSSSNELWLKIPHITYRETGDYQCVAENEHGAVEGSITITVQYSTRNLSITSLAAIKDSSISVIEGNSAVIICSVVSFPASNLMWSHLNVTVNRTSSSNELWLKIPHITYRETGDYQCMAENEHGAVEGSITIIVQYSPRNLSITSLAAIKDSSISVIEGNSAVIICSVVSFPASNLMWRHLNVTVNRTSSSNEVWLEIPHITHRETGDYQCVAENEHGAVEGSITITVEYPPRNLTITSLGVINDSSINIIEGNSAVIICSVESFPASNLTWRHLNVTVNRTHSNNELWLEIPHITYRATGDYQCVAENEHGAVEGYITITVEYSPQNLSMTSVAVIKDSSVNIIEGNSAVIVCSVDSFPASILTWIHLNVAMNRTSSSNELWLEIPHITHRETGDYQCVAENEHGAVEGSITIIVEYAPRNLSITSLAVIQNSSISVIEGNSAVIICSVESFPASNLTWRHLNVTVNSTSSNNELWLEIPRVTFRETRDYQCVAENGHGAVEGSLTVTVQYPSRNLTITSLTVIKDSSINIIEGSSAVIICSVESFPASNLTWRYLNVAMNRTSSNNELWLEIPYVTSKETGDYQCVAENDHGAVEGYITIIVQYPPRETTVSISGASAGIREGHNVTLICSSQSVPPILHYTWFRMEDGPEISWESECAQRAEGITCACVANSNPPGDLTWHLPHANLSGNQTHGGFVSQQLRVGHLVMGSLILKGDRDEQKVMASCSIRNPHGAATHNMYLWVRDRGSSKWTVGLVVIGIMLTVFLAGILIMLSVKKRKTATEETASKTSDIVLTDRRVSVKHQGSPDMKVTDPQDTIREGETPSPQDVFDSPVGGDAGHENPNRTEDLLYANINFSKLPKGDGTVHRGEDTEYAKIRFQPN
ncbi:sialoadhesin-like isoform X3 [Chiloscyllium punctatum]|uniref:sialoadhesin-like isoform X3 n=1 Tax=Chiloscyllium punctatum TaxID=137246 RepID=UPI003B63A90F